MNALILTAVFMTTPLIISGVFHMWAVKKKVINKLSKPIMAKWFGANKTWRGLLVIPVATILGVWICDKFLWSSNLLFSFHEHSLLVWGIALGLGYALAELPNSFIKRRLGVPEGQRPIKNKWLFALIDQADSVVGCLIVYYILAHISFTLIVSVLIVATGLHMLINFALYTFKLRKEPI